MNSAASAPSRKPFTAGMLWMASAWPRSLAPGRGRGETLPSMDRTGVRRGAQTSSGHVVPFPPLARTPPPPRSRFDPRQANVARVVGALLDAVGGSAGARPTNLATGFRASAVDVGRVKAIVEAGIAAFDMHQVDVFPRRRRARPPGRRPTPAPDRSLERNGEE